MEIADKKPANGSRLGVSGSPERPAKLNVGREILLTRASITLTALSSAAVAFALSRVLIERYISSRPWFLIEDVCFGLIVYAFIFGSVLHQFSRLGYLKRLQAHLSADHDDIEVVYELPDPPSLAILVPSYREERRVVRQTLMSCALLEYPYRRIVLLLDDPPNPADPAEAAETEAMRRLPHEIQMTMQPQERKYTLELAEFERRRASGPLDMRSECARLRKLYEDAAKWLENHAAGYEVRDHTDALFVERILREPAREHRERAARLGRIRDQSVEIAGQLLREYRRLAALFTVRLSIFERKRFVNLSHAANKAMNLNSFIAMLGRNFREVIRSDGLHLEECEPAMARLRVPPAEFILTLDADSLLLRPYALRLIHIMKQPGNERIAVAQTPYSAVPGTRSTIERVAGAFTDIQYIVHQGSHYHGAAFWVGANALLRRKALEDICFVTEERGYPIRKYIQDRTVIEDTESTVDLISCGWHIFNYMERLAYSATPPDFGALIVQRRRWSNGGLLILPKLLRHLVSGRNGKNRVAAIPEAAMRIYYLVAAPVINLAMLVLLTWPFEDHLESIWSYLYLCAFPYYFLFGRDLVGTGYSWPDLARVYSLSLLLVPVNLSGVAKSLQQWWTGQATPFARTPKVPGRTSVQKLYIAAPILLSIWNLALAIHWVRKGSWFLCGFSLANSMALGYALVRYVQVRHAIEDLGLHRQNRRRVTGFDRSVLVASSIELAASQSESVATADL